MLYSNPEPFFFNPSKVPAVLATAVAEWQTKFERGAANKLRKMN